MNQPIHPRWTAPVRRWRLWTTRGRLPVYACGVCACLVLDERSDQHSLWHVLSRPNPEGEQS